MQQYQPYLNSHQTRTREPDTYENLLGDALERCFAGGIHDLDGICARLNQDCVPSPAAQTWTPALLQQELKRLSA